MTKFFIPTHTRVKRLQWFLHLAIIPALYFGTLQLWLMALCMFWVVHGLGSGIGAHRYFTHHSFKTSRIWEIIMSFFFTVSCTGSTVGYVLMHTKHHTHSDKEDDPHSPHQHFVKTWWGLYDQEKLRFGHKLYSRLMKHDIMRFFHNYYFAIIICYVTALLLINPLLVIYLFAIPAMMQFQMNAVLIVLVHSEKSKAIGATRNVDTNDNSHNIWWLKPLLLGEELHNNHHSNPSSVTMSSGRGFREFDPLLYVIKYVIRGTDLKFTPFK
jgi:stearoyl-CoA desaturase (delta-9 desaturase)